MPEQDPKKRFGYLDTDEILERPRRRQHSLDQTIGAGCVAFTAASVANFACVVIPFVVAGRLETYDALYRIAALGGMLALGMGLLATHFCSLPGLAGSIAGLLPAGVFVYLYLWHETTQAPAIEGYQAPEFTPDYSWKVPLVLSAAATVVWLGYFWLRTRGNRADSSKRSQ